MDRAAAEHQDPHRNGRHDRRYDRAPSQRPDVHRREGELGNGLIGREHRA
jgi:hypothetical protein